jgi:multidrug transporter EmrE-like cation transporter
MGLINVMWSGLSVLVIVSTGVLFFNEKITNLDRIGIFLVLLGILCILYE